MMHGVIPHSCEHSFSSCFHSKRRAGVSGQKLPEKRKKMQPADRKPLVALGEDKPPTFEMYDSLLLTLCFFLILVEVHVL
jgi:hypothetical protein